MLPARRRRDRSDGRRAALGPPWAREIGVAASLVVVLVAAVVWHTRRPGPAKAELMHWHEVASVREPRDGDRFARGLHDRILRDLPTPSGTSAGEYRAAADKNGAS